MSRGHGRVQLQVLDFLLRYGESARARGDQDAYVAIAEIAGQGATRSRIESVRRAAKSLADEGLILLRSDDSQRSTPPDRRLTAVHQSHGLLARLAPSSDERAADGDVANDNELSA